MTGITVEVDTRHLERLFAALPVDMATAAKRAAARTRDWLATQLKRELAGQTQIRQLAFKERFRKGRQEASLWIGLNPIKATYAGTGVMTAKGARVGPHVFDGAFVATMKSGHRGIFLRKGKPRLPIVEIRIPIDDEMEEILPRYERAAENMFAERLEHEVNYLLMRKAA